MSLFHHIQEQEQEQDHVAPLRNTLDLPEILLLSRGS